MNPVIVSLEYIQSYVYGWHITIDVGSEYDKIKYTAWFQVKPTKRQIRKIKKEAVRYWLYN